MQKLDLAWAAGLFDGEGSVNNAAKGKLRLSVAQTDREVLDRFAKAVGLGTVNGPYGPYEDGPTKKPLFAYTANTRHAEKVLNDLWPYLSSVKKEDARRAIDVANEALVRKTTRKYEVPA